MSATHRQRGTLVPGTVLWTAEEDDLVRTLPTKGPTDGFCVTALHHLICPTVTRKSLEKQANRVALPRYRQQGGNPDLPAGESSTPTPLFSGNAVTQGPFPSFFRDFPGILALPPTVCPP
jgi:hypothetical protein